MSTPWERSRRIATPVQGRETVIPEGWSEKVLGEEVPGSSLVPSRQDLRKWTEWGRSLRLRIADQSLCGRNVLVVIWAVSKENICPRGKVKL